MTAPLPNFIVPEPDTLVAKGGVVGALGSAINAVIAPELGHFEPYGPTRDAQAIQASFKATVISFDPNRDLALLRVPGLGQAPLAVGTAKAGITGAVFGHPGGAADLTVSPAGIRQQR